MFFFVIGAIQIYYDDDDDTEWVTSQSDFENNLDPALDLENHRFFKKFFTASSKKRLKQWLIFTCTTQ